MEIKPAKTFEEQMAILKSRGLEFDLDPEPILKKISYYRLSGFMFQYQIKCDESTNAECFQAGTKFSHIYNAYKFDQQLRNLLVGILAHVEINFRTYIAYTIGTRLGPEGHFEFRHFQSDSSHQSIVDRILESRKHRKDLPFVQHHLNKKGGHFPVWVDVELIPFAVLSDLLKNLHDKDRLFLNGTFVQVEPSNLTVWVDNLVKLRNHCAHYNRIYNQSYDDLPLYGLYKEDIQSNSLFARLIAIKDLTNADQEWDLFKDGFIYTVQQFEDCVDMTRIGLPSNWKELLRRPFKPYSIKFN